ncbi:DNA repair protein rad52 [Sporothrix eucalyptigena]|uniref:DNA repair protein rad52 n=1 Tax=Sporothrix eucalyptigena TaxID=1812306 RepID=A0ABP0C1W1_9PEZI
MPAPGDQHQTVPNPFNQSMQPQSGFGDMNQQQQQPAQRISEYTAKEIATLQSRLEKQLGPEYLSARSGPSGQKVHYIAAEKVITLANEVFGFNGWSSSIQNIQIDFVDEHPQTFKISVGLSVIVRVTLRDGTYHEDIGYGHIENCKGKAAAFEKAKKEGTTDALKRALRSFGNVLGNCIYDKKYVERVSKMKAVPVNKRTFAERDLHRHADYIVKSEEEPGAINVATAAPLPAVSRLPEMGAAAVKSEMSALPEAEFNSDLFDDDLLGDFDEADFCVSNEGHPDEFIVHEASVPALPPPQQNQGSRNTSPLRQVQPPQQNNSYNQSRPNGGVVPRPPQTPTPMNNRPNGSGNNFGQRPNLQGVNNQQANRPPQQTPRPQSLNGNGSNNNGNGSNKPVSLSTAGGSGNGGGDGEGTPWLSARAIAKASDGDALSAVAPSIQANHLFNPKAESPSIRKTPGVDHNSSKPIPRLNRPVGSGVLPPSAHAAAGGSLSTANNSTAASSGGMTTRSGVNHATSEPIRRIGAPPSTASPLANRNQFRPPPMKRPADSPAPVSRPPLADVPSNVSTAGGTVVAAGATAGAAGVDAKRQKLA